MISHTPSSVFSIQDIFDLLQRIPFIKQEILRKRSQHLSKVVFTSSLTAMLIPWQTIDDYQIVPRR